MGTASRVPVLWVGCEVSLQLLRSPSAPLPRDPHPTATLTSVLPTPLEAQQRLTLPKTHRCSLSLGSHLPRPPHSSWYRRAVPMLAELWTPGQTDSPSPWEPLYTAVLRLWGHSLVLGCQRGAMGAGRGGRAPKGRMGGQRYEEHPALSTLSHLPCILHCVLRTEHPVAPSALHRAPCTQHHS